MVTPHPKPYCFTDKDRRKSLETRQRNRNAATTAADLDWTGHYEREQQIRTNLETALEKHINRLCKSGSALSLKQAIRLAAKLYGW